jgi:phage terminase small subunit
LKDILQPTADLTADEMIHFDRVIKSREASTWLPHDLSIATDLAKTMRRFKQLQEQLDAEGLTMVNPRGTLVAHPLLSASMTMSSTIQALSRTLGLSAPQRGLGDPSQAKRNVADIDARKVIERASEEGLL